MKTKRHERYVKELREHQRLTGTERAIWTPPEVHPYPFPEELTQGAN